MHSLVLFGELVGFTAIVTATGEILRRLAHRSTPPDYLPRRRHAVGHRPQQPPLSPYPVEITAPHAGELTAHRRAG